MCDLISDVICYCVRSCDVDKINVYDKIMIENQKRKHGNKRIFYINLRLKMI